MAEYPRLGDSQEVRDLITFALRVPGARITCTTNHKLFASFLKGRGLISWHRKKGTNGNGRAIDVGGTPPVMRAVFQLFESVRSNDIHELIHTPMGYSFKDGIKVPPIAAADHYNHVHISVQLGTKFDVPGPAPFPIPQTEVHEMMAYDPISGGNWTVDETGAVFANDGAPYLGGLNNHPEWNTDSSTTDGDPANGHVVGIVFWKGDGSNAKGNGYAIGFRFDGSPQPSLYHLDRDGNANKGK